MKKQTKITNSSNISAVDYDTETKELGITFKSSGKRFEYYNVPESVYNGIVSAPSAGKYYHANIRGKYE